MDKDSKTLIISGIIVAVALIGGIYFLSKNNSAPGKLDSFATCIKNSGAIFYGAFWCPHCQATKRMFGNSAKLLPYVECSTPDGNDQTQVCKDKKIESYPTWVFADGSTLTGETTLEQLSAKTSCPIDNSTTTPIISTSTAPLGSSSPIK